METTDITMNYKKFKSSLKDYHDGISKDNEPDVMMAQYERRSEILSDMIELCNTIAPHSYHLVSALREYGKRNSVNPHIVQQFDFILIYIIKLIDKKDELYLWDDEISSEYKKMVEMEVVDMKGKDIENLKTTEK